jgi:alpha-beta hydrolase superfamily lysophospholipase
MLAMVAWLLMLCGSEFPAMADEVEIDGLAATFLAPEATAAAAVIIAGSGPTDRNGNSHLGLKTDAYKLLAEALLDRSIATVRFDKRGIGGSAKSARPEAEVVFGHYVDDVAAVARWLKTRAAGKAIFLIGHSEGGTLALLAAKQVPTAGVVLLTAPGRTLGTILREQYSRPGTLRDLAPEAMNIVAALERGEAVAEVDPRLAAAFRPSVQPYLRSSIALDPAALARGIRVPLLIVGGGRDFQVGKSDFDALSAARPDAAAYWDPDMAHTLKMSRADPQSVQRAYTDPSQPLAPSLSDRVAEFILARK